MLGIGVLLQLSWLEHRASPSSLLGSAWWPCPQAGLGNSLCLQNTFFQCVDYGGSFLSAHILYLPGHMPKLCESGLTLNKEPISVTGFPPVYLLQQSFSLHLLSHRLSLVLHLSQSFFESQRARQLDTGMLLAHQQLLDSAMNTQAGGLS